MPSLVQSTMVQSTRLAERAQLVVSEWLIVEEAVAAVLAEQVDEDVLVRQRDTELLGGDGARHGHDRGGHLAGCGWSESAVAGGTSG